MSRLPVVVSLVLAAFTASASAFLRPGSFDPHADSCPLERAMEDFDMSKFMGDWYVLEYEYTKEMRMKDLSCVAFKFTLTEDEDLISNFTFRFPPTTGFFYHMPTVSIVSDLDNAVWETNFKKIELISVVLDTDYSRWAVLAQCRKGSSDSPKLLSTRVLSRTRTLGAADWDRVRAAIRESGADAPHKYSIDQADCNENEEY